jgi:S-DNA-T family DNA segregation ATPase FtsK/SpoIIIE
MARKRPPSKLRPKRPARVRRKRGRRARGHHYAELVGLGLLALGLFLVSVLVVGWNGGYAGGWAEAALRAVIGDAAPATPVALAALGGLMVARSALIDMRPFRTGLAVLVFGSLLTLGRDHGGYAGRALEALFGRLLGETGALILGATALVAGVLLLTGASAGALLRRSGRTVRRSGRAVRESRRAVRRAGGAGGGRSSCRRSGGPRGSRRSAPPRSSTQSTTIPTS